MPLNRHRLRPWSFEETDARFTVRDACFIVCDANGQALPSVYFEEEPGRWAATRLMTRDEARRIAANIANLPELVGQSLAALMTALD